MILLTLIMLVAGVFPVGDNCILKTDMYHQYAPFFSEFREKLQTGGSLKFTWDLGLGVNFTAIMAYYLASPLNWLILFVSKDYVLEFMTVMIVMKCGLSAAAMAAYLRYRSPEEYFGAYLFSLFYALSGYYCAYYWNLMWLDSFAIFPIVIMGAEKLIKGESGVLYAASLGYCILANYYISIMICLFLILYFFLFCILKGFDRAGDFIRTGLRFAFWSLIAGCLAAVLLLPEIYALGATASSESTFPKSITEYFPMMDMLARHMAGVQTEQWLKHFPNVFCGTAAYLMFCLYVMSRKIGLKEKIVYISAALFMLAGFSINVLNFIWHGFRYPNSLPARQSFIYCFLVIVMCFRVYECRRGILRRELAVALAASMAFILAAQKLIDNDEFHFAVFYGAMLLTALYAGILHMYRRGRWNERTAAAAVLALVIVELAANTAITSFTITSRSAYIKDNAEIRNLLDNLQDPDFYRVERVNRKTKDDGAWLNFHSVSLFSSMASKDCSDFFKRVGCEASTNAYSITGSTPFMNMLFGVKYQIFDREQTDNEALIPAGHEGDVWLYRNPYTLPIGYLLPSDIMQNWMLELDDPVLVQNSFCDELGVGQVLVPVQTGSESGGKYKVTLSEDGEYYAFAGNAKAEKITVNWPDRKKTFEHLDRRYLMELGNCRKGDLITISSDDSISMDLRLYRFDYGVLKDIYDKMSPHAMEVSAYADGYLKGTVSVDSRALGYSAGKAVMMISTPYDEGWKVLVDGEPVKIVRGLETFTAFYLSDGEHEIEMKYEPGGLRAGSLISVAALLVVIGFAAAGIVRKNKKPEEEIPDNVSVQDRLPEDPEQVQH